MTEAEIDKSHLPSVHNVCQCFSVLEDGALAHSLQEQEIEQYYSANVQKNQVVHSDLRLARRLQDEEEHQAQLCQDLQQLVEQDYEYARMIQTEIQRQSDEARRREAEDEEMAKQLQREEEMEIRQQRSNACCHDNADESALSEGKALLHLGVLQQVLEDAELARRLQEEENRKPQRKSPGPPLDFRAAQVAQDEEIARFMQRQEKKAHHRSRHVEVQGRTDKQQDEEGDANRRKMLQIPRERLNSEGLHSPVEEDNSQEHHPPNQGWTHTLHEGPIHNIAEELDPTFKARKRESQLMGNSSSGLCLAARAPHSIFYDYLPEPAFIPPTKRQNDRSTRPKTKEKRESCKQQ
ncbi:coiled-coil domain-containing protein 50 [Chanos chanos]|uniref:Coiled-coil domain-containing protein 50 n=1 Tax=Chanos chanos TaxID=29144 RepID=A0A6J2VTK4_CHACN|nr:coiled-coil domain-containing protein 50-like [Chanos chanos]